MARSNNRRAKQKGLPGSHVPSSGGGGKDLKSAPFFKAKKKVFAKNKNLPYQQLKRSAGPAKPLAKKGKHHISKAKGRGGGAAKPAGGPKQQFRFHLPPINASSASYCYSYQKVPWKGGCSEPNRPGPAANLGTASDVSVSVASSVSSPSGSNSHVRRSSSLGSRSICSRISAGPAPTEGIPQPLLDALDRELEQFGSFVRLTPVEIQARNRVAGAVQRAATQQYSGARVQPFGSFATQEVCCFLSDIDLAVEGIVTFPSCDPEVLDSRSKEARKRKREGNEAPGAKEQSSTDLKRERVKQWMLALESVDAANESSQGDVDDESASDRKTLPAREGARDEKEAETDIVEKQSPSSGSSGISVSSSIGPDGCGSGERDCDDSERDFASSKRTADTDPVSLLSEDSDQDSADKLTTLSDWVRSNRSSSTQLSDQKQLTSAMSDTDSDDDDASQCDTSGMEVSMNVAPVTTTIDKETREMCIDALKRIKRKLQKQVRVNRREGVGCQLIKARVPIVKLELPAFEVDVAVAGCNGADTAAYSGDQVARFQSFAPVVLFLKILLNQNKLDVPFEGGLGSYKLYVLVAHHIEKHLEHGGADRPGEVLLGFLFRYGTVARSYVGKSVSDFFRTHLSITSMIKCGGGSADLSNVFLIRNCCKLFDMAWHRLQAKLSSQSNPPTSFLDTLVDSSQLRREREKRISFATLTMHTSNYLKD